MNDEEKRLFQAQVSNTVQKTIGNLNGRWSILFRAQLVIVAFALPLSITWATWATSTLFAIRAEQQAFISTGPRYTPAMARADDLELRQEILREVETKYPPTWLRDEVISISRRLETIEKNLK